MDQVKDRMVRRRETTITMVVRRETADALGHRRVKVITEARHPMMATIVDRRPASDEPFSL
jgi:hypothetical protein